MAIDSSPTTNSRTNGKFEVERSTTYKRMKNLYDNVWSEKYRPKKVDDLVLSEDIRDFFSERKNIPNLLFFGKPGTGKTTMAKILANEISPDSYLYINASETNGIDVIRNEIKTFVSTKSMDGSKKTVILDEADGLSSASTGSGSSAQSALRNIMEEYLENVRFILTANYPNKITKPLKSRCTQIEFSYDIKDVLKRMIFILKSESIKITQENLPDLKKLVKDNFPDIRKCINSLQFSCKSGVFSYKEKIQDNSFVRVLYETIKEESPESWQEQCFNIRKFILDNEDKFNNDYHDLMRKLFDIYCENHESPKKILIIVEAMEKHNIVMDLEVNAFAMFIKLIMEEKAKN